jgi:hypothetical protein
MNLNRGNGKAKHTATPNVASPWDRMDSFFFVVLIESNAFDLSFQYENPVVKVEPFSLTFQSIHSIL